MNIQEKNQVIEQLTQQLNSNNNFYLADVLGLTVEESNKLRKLCYGKKVSLHVVKNTLLRKAMERSEKPFDGLYEVLKGNTSIMFTEEGNTPAKVIMDFRKNHSKPILKAAFIEEQIYIGDEQLDMLSTIKSKKELIADVILLLQSPTNNVLSALQSGKIKLAGIVKTLSER